MFILSRISIDLFLSSLLKEFERFINFLFRFLINLISSFVKVFLLSLRFLFKLQINFLLLMKVSNWKRFLIDGTAHFIALNPFLLIRLSFR